MYTNQYIKPWEGQILNDNLTIIFFCSSKDLEIKKHMFLLITELMESISKSLDYKLIIADRLSGFMGEIECETIDEDFIIQTFKENQITILPNQNQSWMFDN